MITVTRTADFQKWIDGLADRQAQRRIAMRIVRVEAGNFGDAKSVGKVSELRVDVGPGYRVYFTRRGLEVVLLLCGGDKSTQDADIAAAQKMVEELDAETKRKSAKKKKRK